MKKYFLLALTIIFLTSCKYKEITIGDVQSVSIGEVTKEYATVKFSLPINNPNNFNFKISKISLDVSLNGFNLGNAYDIDKVKVEKNSNDVHKFTIKVKLEGLANSGLGFLGALLSNKVKLNLKGYVKANAFLIGTKKIDVNMEKSVKLFKDLK
jgi:LEA14-like dessication related protein